jgi:hypothetical protein
VSLRFYMDVQIPLGVTEALTQRGIDVLTSQQDGTGRLPDARLLDRATALDRVIVSHDTDFLSEGRRRQRAKIDFVGIVFSPQLGISYAKMIRDLQFIAELMSPAEMRAQIVFLPLPGA